VASKTVNYGLTKLAPGDDLSANGYAFIDSDRDRIDGLLALGREHEHTGAAAGLLDPEDPPSLVLDTTQGSLSAGQTYRYRFTYVDQFGSETAASPEATVTTAPPVVAPEGVSVTSVPTGGTLRGGLYYYALTAYVDTSSRETRRGPVAAHSIPFASATNTVTLSLPSLPAGASGFNVYRRGPGESNYNFVAEVDMDVATPPTEFEDDGAIAPNCDRNPPISNSTNSQNSVTVTLPGATPAVPEGATWKIYRSQISGVWESSDLVQVTETVTDVDPEVVASYLDVGIPTGFQTPPEQSQIVGMPDKITLTDAAEVEGYLPPGLLVIPHEISWQQKGATTEDVSLDMWVCPFEYAEIQNVRLTLPPDASPAVDEIIADVNYYSLSQATPGWETVFTTQSERPTVQVGEWQGDATVPDVVSLVEGDLLTWDVDQEGGGGTPGDFDLVITILLHVKQGSETTTNDLTQP
jgi:hypothetical protein